MSDESSWLDAIGEWCKKFQYKALKAGHLVDPHMFRRLYAENDVMTIADDFTKKKLYYLHYSATDNEYTITPACKALADSKFEGNSLQEFKSDLDAAGVDAENAIL